MDDPKPNRQPSSRESRRDRPAASPSNGGNKATSAGSKKPNGHGRLKKELVTEEEAELRLMRDLTIPLVLTSIHPVKGKLRGAGAMAFMKQLLREAGNPTDFIERTMIEQLALAHYRIASLHAAASDATDTERIKVLSAAAARLLGEFRRLALALKTYRTGPSNRQFTVVRQQNIAGGEQQVTYVDQSAGEEKVAMQCHDGSATGVQEDAANDDAGRISFGEEPQPRGGRPFESAKA